MESLPWEEPTGWPQDAAAERMIGDWQIYQRSGGHRTSTDDVLTAYFAAWRSVQRGVVTKELRYLDLGCGVASVLMMTAYRLRPALCIGLEAQAQSVEMARRSVSALPVEAPAMRIESGDFREHRSELGHFGLITGSPPYFPLGTGSLPADPQRRACRFEARGGIEAYCSAAANYLAPGAKFYAVFQSLWDERVQDAARAVGFELQARLDLRMREDRAQPFLTVYEMGRESTPLERFAFSIRDLRGKISPDYAQARDFLGLSNAEA